MTDIRIRREAGYTYFFPFCRMGIAMETFKNRLLFALLLIAIVILM